VSVNLTAPALPRVIQNSLDPHYTRAPNAASLTAAASRPTSKTAAGPVQTQGSSSHPRDQSLRSPFQPCGYSHCILHCSHTARISVFFSHTASLYVLHRSHATRISTFFMIAMQPESLCSSLHPRNQNLCVLEPTMKPPLFWAHRNFCVVQPSAAITWQWVCTAQYKFLSHLLIP
jgi:hypothetical protein